MVRRVRLWAMLFVAIVVIALTLSRPASQASSPMLIAPTIPDSSSHPSAADNNSANDKPQYNQGGELVRPGNFREWTYLSSGLGMSYNATGGGDPQFTNVFVPTWAYREFVATAKWPDKTMFVVEERTSTSKGSINKAGRFQTDMVGYGVEVKDETRFPEKWAYFTFAPDAASASAKPKAVCWQCHEDHAAVEHSFVQFYPTLKPVAQKFGVYKEKP
jgi:Cytochrome P460